MWFHKNKKTIIGIAAAVILAVLILVVIKIGSSDYGVRGSLQNMISAVTKPIAQTADGIRKGVGGIFRFKEITAENEALQEKVARLQQEKTELKLTRQEKEELEELQQVFEYKEIEKKEVIAANISAMDYSGWQGVFTIDRGSQAGIKKGSPVISADGLIGKVVEVSEKTAKVASLLAENNKVSFQKEEDHEATGVLQSDGKGSLSGYLLEDDAEIQKGDELVTSGIGIYPAGLKIGKVINVEKKKGTQKVILSVRPETSVFGLRKVGIVL